jgi:hypothetical protein
MHVDRQERNVNEIISVCPCISIRPARFVPHCAAHACAGSVCTWNTSLANWRTHDARGRSASATNTRTMHITSANCKCAMLFRAGSHTILTTNDFIGQYYTLRQCATAVYMWWPLHPGAGTCRCVRVSAGLFALAICACPGRAERGVREPSMSLILLMKDMS